MSEGQVEQSEAKIPQITARNWEDGSEISETVEKQGDVPVVWQPDVHTIDPRNLRGTEKINRKMTFPSQPKPGSIVDFGERHFLVLKPKHDHLAQRWGKDSVFVQPLSTDEYNSMVQSRDRLDL